MAELRAQQRRLLRDALQAAGAPAPSALAVDLEHACYNVVLEMCQSAQPPIERRWTNEQFRELYCDHTGMFVLYLRPDALPTRAHGASEALRDWMAGRRAAADVARLGESDLCPAALAPERQQMRARAQPQPQARGSDLYQCRRCKQRNVRYTQVQRRSGDEAPDIDVECLEEGCGGKFTIRG